MVLEIVLLGAIGVFFWLIHDKKMVKKRKKWNSYTKYKYNP